MKKVNIRLDMDLYTEKAIKSFCKENNISFVKFVEDALIEKLEAEEMNRNPLMEGKDDSYGPDDAENTLFESEEDLYKKKH